MGATKTPNLGLNNWQGNEFPKRSDFAQDNLILDTKIKEIEDNLNNIDLTANKVTIADATNVFTATDVEGALLENKTSILALQNNDGDLAALQTVNKTNLVSSINELFQSASNGKNLVATAITGKGVNASGSETFSALSSKIDSILVEKHLNVPQWYNFSNTWLTAGVTNELTYSDQIAVGDKIYAFGCADGFIRVYDTVTNMITTKSAKTALNKYRRGLVHIDGKIYCQGGYISPSTTTSTHYTVDTNEVYDINSDIITTKTKVLQAKHTVSINAIGTNIYNIGGAIKGLSQNEVFQNTNYKYDTLTDIWSTMAAMPESKGYIFSGVYNNLIYCLGGEKNSTYNTSWYLSSALNQVYNPSTNTWSTKAPLASSKGGKAVLHGNKMYCIGGNWASESYMYTSNSNIIYDFVEDTYSTGLNAPYDNVFGVGVGKNIYNLTNANSSIYCI